MSNQAGVEARRGARWILWMLALAAACGDGARESTPASEAPAQDAVRRGGTAVVAELADIQMPMPLVWEAGLDADMMDVLYMSLTRGGWENGRSVYLLSDHSPMAMAWHYEFTGPDSTALRYRMRSGLQWSDGQPITAADVVWTYRMYADKELGSPRQSQTEQIDSVTAENDSTVVFHFKRRYPEMLFDSGLPIAPAHAYRDTPAASLRTHPSLSHPERMVTSGPWKVGAWQPGAQLTLVHNTFFPEAQRPRLDRLVIKVIPETTTRLVELQNGTVDFARSVPYDQIPGLRQRMPSVQFEREQGRYWEYVAYNPKALPQFADPEIRRALALAIDVQAIVDQLRMAEFVSLAAGPYPPIFADLADPSIRPLAQDTARAKQILESKGWRDADGDGIREKGGTPFRFTLITNTGNQRRADVITILQRMWRQVGVDVRLQTYDLMTVNQRTNGEARDFEAALGSWGSGLNPDLRPLWAEDSRFNIVSYRNAEVTRLMEQAAQAPTAERAYPLWRQAAARIVQDQPYTWLYYYDPVTARAERLRGVKVNTYGAYQNTFEWWLANGPRAAGDTARGGR